MGWSVKLVFMLVVVVMVIVLGVLASRSADKAEPPTVNTTATPSTLESSQLRDADDLFRIKPVLDYFQDVWTHCNDVHRHTSWETDLDAYINMINGKEVTRFDDRDKPVDFYLDLKYGISKRNFSVYEGLRFFLKDVKRFLDLALKAVANNKRRYQGSVVSSSRGELRRFEQEELRSWTDMLDAVNEQVATFDELYYASTAKSVAFQKSEEAYKESVQGANGDSPGRLPRASNPRLVRRAKLRATPAPLIVPRGTWMRSSAYSPITVGLTRSRGIFFA